MKAQVYDYLNFFRQQRKGKKANPIHIAIYYYLVEVCNTKRWTETFEVNVPEAMRQIGIKKDNTWYDHIALMEAHGYIKYHRVKVSDRKKMNPKLTLQTDAFREWMDKRPAPFKGADKRNILKRSAPLNGADGEQPAPLNGGIY